MKAMKATAMKAMKAKATKKGTRHHALHKFWITKTKARWFRTAKKGFQNQRTIFKMIRWSNDETLERLIAQTFNSFFGILVSAYLFASADG